LNIVYNMLEINLKNI